MLISEKDKDLVKNCLGRGLYVSFSTTGLHPGSWIIDFVSREKFPCDNLCGESDSFAE